MPDDAPPPAPTPPRSEVEARKRRYSPSPAARPVTARQRQALGLVADLQPLATSQVRRMLDLDPKAALRTLRALFDAGLVEKLAIPRAVMAETPEAAACRGLYEDLYRALRARAHGCWVAPPRARGGDAAALRTRRRLAGPAARGADIVRVGGGGPWDGAGGAALDRESASLR